MPCLPGSSGGAVFYPSKLLAPFTPRAGRMSQSTYILGFVLPFVAVLGLTWLLLVAAPGLLGTPGYLVVSLGWTVIMATGDACNIRRWNDLGRSAALYKLLRPGLVLLPLLAVALQFLVPAHRAMAGDMEALAFMMGMEFGGISWQPAPLALLGITLAAGLANVAYLSVMPGQQGANAYGPDPHGDPIVPGGGAVHRGSADGEDDPVNRGASSTRAPTPGAFGKKRN